MAYFSRNIPISIIQGFFGIGNDPNYPLVNCYITMERSTMLLMGKSTISMVIFNSYVSHYQRLNLHFPMVFLWFSYGFPMVYQRVFLLPMVFSRGVPPRTHFLLRCRGAGRAAARGSPVGAWWTGTSQELQAVPSCSKLSFIGFTKKTIY